MLRPCRTAGFALSLVACTLLSAIWSGAQTLPPSKSAASTAHKTKARAKKPVPVEVPEPAPPPPTLEQQPPTQPQVTYRDGQLSINSSNSTLSQVLRSVQSQTGAAIEIPPAAGSERVVANLGPGKPQTVLASLLNGSKFNYVILGEPNNSGAVQKVILLAKSSAPAGDNSPAMTQNNYRQGQMPPQSQAVEPPPDEEYPQPEPEVENQNPQPGQPGMPGSENLTPDQINPAGRTPEQMLQELQRMQQQQQQMQQQLNPANQQPSPNQFNQQFPPPQQQPVPNQPQQPQ